MNVSDLRIAVDKDGKEYVCVYDVMQLLKINHNDSVAVYTSLQNSDLSRKIETNGSVLVYATLSDIMSRLKISIKSGLYRKKNKKKS